MSSDSSPLNDPRWIKFSAGELPCSCGERHEGMFPIHIQTPIGWPGPKTYEPDDALRMEGDFLSANFSVWQGQYFAMRMRLPMRIQNAEPWAFVFTVWASLNRPDFEGYRESLKSGRLKGGERAQARLVNKLTGFSDTFKLLGTAIQQDDGGLPLLLLHGAQPDNDPDHLIIKEQRDGISLDRMFDLYAGYGHDMRPGLS